MADVKPGEDIPKPLIAGMRGPVPDVKRALVTLAPGDSIDIFEV